MTFDKTPAKVTLEILKTEKIQTEVNFSGISIVFYPLKIIFKFLTNFQRRDNPKLMQYIKNRNLSKVCIKCQNYSMKKTSF